MTAGRWAGLAALVAVGALPLLGAWLRSGCERCGMDGAPVSPAFRVRVVTEDGRSPAFCGVRCAQAWLRAGGRARGVLVTDCASGREVSAEEATFVECVGLPAEGEPDPIRAFARREDAERHAAAHRGTILDGAARPFGGGGERP